MTDQGDQPGAPYDPEGRIARARSAIDRSFDELSARGAGAGPEGGATKPPQGPSPPQPGFDPVLEGRVAEATDAIDRRVREMVSARLGAAERRLELQSKALEAALGEEAIQARLAVEEVEEARSALKSASEAARRELGGASGDVPGRGGGEAVRDELHRALAHLREVAAQMSAEAAAAARTAAEEAITRRISGDIGSFEGRITSVEAEARGRLQMALDRSVEDHGKVLQRRTDAELASLREEALAEAGRAAAARAATGLAEGERRLTMRIESVLDQGREELEGRLRESISRLEAAVEERGRQLESRLAGCETDVALRLEDAEARLAAGSDARLAAETQRIERVGSEIERRWVTIRAEYEALAQRVPAIAEERAARVADERLTGTSDRITAELGAARSKLEGRVEDASRDAEQRLRDWIAREAEPQLVDRAQGEVISRLEDEVNEVEVRVRAAVDAAKAAAESSDEARERLGTDVCMLREDLERQRSELGRRSIMRERKRLEEEGAAQLARIATEAEAKREELAAGVVSETASQVDRVADQLREAARTQIERALTDVLGGRIRGFEEQVDQMMKRKLAAAEQALAASAAASEQRLVEVDRAQEREEQVRRRTEEAKAEADARVRAAEQRLVQVLAQLERATLRSGNDG